MLLEEDEISWRDVQGNNDAESRPRKQWPDDLRAALRILHSKVARKSIASVPFMAEIISNDVGYTGNCCPAVFSRIVAKAGTSAVRTCVFMYACRRICCYSAALRHLTL